MFEDFYMPQFDADYFNSPAFQQAIAAAVQQYSPAPVEPVYYAPEPVYYAPEPAPEITAGIGDIPQYMVEDYGLIGGAPDRFTAPQISAEQLAAERYAADQAAQQMEAQRAAAERYAAEQAAAQQAEAQRVAAEQAAAAQYAAQQAEAQRVAAAQAAAEQAAAQQAAAAAEAQRVAAAQELAARAEAERVAAERAAAAEAAAQRQQTELNERRAQAAQAAAERAAQERALAEQAAAQAAAEAQAAVQAQAEAAAQAEAQRVAAAQAQAEAQAQAQAAEQARVQAAQQAEAQRVAAQQAEAQRVADAQAAQRAAEVQAEAQRVAAEQAAAERAASERAAAEQAAAQAEAQRVAAAQEASAKAEAERVALARAQELEAAAARTNNEVAAARAEQARIAAERATAEREAAEQASIQAEVAAQEQARVQAEQAAAVAPAPEPVFTPEPQPLSGIGSAVDENYYTPEVQAPEQTYTPAPVDAPEADVARGIGGREVSAEPDYGFAPEQIYVPEPVSAPVYTPPAAPTYYDPAPVAGIGRDVNYYEPDAYYGMPEETYAPVPESVSTPAVEPMTIEAEPVAGIGSPAVAAPAEAPSVIETAAAPAQLTPEQMADRRAAANALPRGTSIVGPYAGKDPLAFGTDNTFNVGEDQEVRLVDAGGNVIFSGSGVDGAKRAVAAAQSLSDDLGKNANYKIQTGERTINPDGSVGETRYIDVARAAPQQTGLGFLADNVLPFAASFIPVIGPVAGAALGAAASSVAQGRSLEDTLKRAVIAAATAGAVKVSGLDATIGGALSNTAGQTAGQVAGQVAGQAAGQAGGDIVVTGLSKALQAAGGALGSTALSQAGNAISRELSGYKTPAEKFAEQPLPEALQPPVVESVVDPIVVSGSRVAPAVADAVTGAVTGIGSAAADAITGFETPADKFVQEPLPEEFQPPAQPPLENAIVVSGNRAGSAAADAVTGAITGIGSGAADALISQPAATEPDKTAEEKIEEETGEIVSLGDKTTPVNVPVPGIGTPGVVDSVTGDIVVSKPKPEPEAVTKEEGLPVGTVLPTLGIPEVPKPDPALTDQKSTLEKIKDAYDIARAGAAVLPLVTGGGDGGNVTMAPDTSKITFRPSTLRPTIPAGRIGGVGGYPYTPQTYGRRGGDQETEYLFFTRDPVTGQELLQSAPAPITTTASNEPAGPAMILPSGNTFAEGGEVDDDMVKHLVEYHKNGGHQGPGQVKGIGSGQDDKIPAWLSDGEYVWSAQDVADLGDGSTDEGVRRLDKMRQMVRRQAGRKDVKKIAKPQKGIDRMLKAVGGLV